jgi:hypothetical protein
VHRADQHVDLVALHQLVRILDTLGGLGLVVDLEPFDLPATQLAAFFVDGHVDAIFDGHAQLRIGAGVRQHQADPNLAALRPRDLRQQQAGGRGADEGGAAREDEAASGHSVVLLFVKQEYFAVARQDVAA